MLIQGGHLEFTNEGRIFNGTNSFGEAGAVLVTADTILIDGQVDHDPRVWTWITATAEPFSFGSASPTVFVSARRFEIVNGGRIVALTGGFGPAGNVVVEATEALSIGGRGVFGPSNISVAAENPYSQAAVGSIVIEAPLVALSDGGRIEATNVGLGPSGGVMVTAQTLRLESGAEITADTRVVDAGDVQIPAEDLVDLWRSAMGRCRREHSDRGGELHRIAR